MQVVSSAGDVIPSPSQTNNGHFSPACVSTTQSLAIRQDPVSSPASFTTFRGQETAPNLGAGKTTPRFGAGKMPPHFGAGNTPPCFGDRNPPPIFGARKLSLTNKLSQINPSLPPTAPGQINQTLIAINGTSINGTAINGTIINGTPIESFGIRQIELQMGPSNHLLFATYGTPIESFGIHQIELQLGLQKYTWRFIIADIMQTQPPTHDPVPLTVFKLSA